MQSHGAFNTFKVWCPTISNRIGNSRSLYKRPKYINMHDTVCHLRCFTDLLENQLELNVLYRRTVLNTFHEQMHFVIQFMQRWLSYIYIAAINHEYLYLKNANLERNLYVVYCRLLTVHFPQHKTGLNIIYAYPLNSIGCTLTAKCCRSSLLISVTYVLWPTYNVIKNTRINILGWQR